MTAIPTCPACSHSYDLHELIRAGNAKCWACRPQDACHVIPPYPAELIVKGEF